MNIAKEKTMYTSEQVEISFQYYLRSAFISLLGIFFGISTIYCGLKPSNHSFIFNTDYTSLGYQLRGICFLCGVVSLYYVVLSIKDKESIRGMLIALGLALSCLVWEVAVALYIVGLVFLIIAAVGARG